MPDKEEGKTAAEAAASTEVTADVLMKGIQSIETLAATLKENKAAETDVTKSMIENSDEIKKAVEVSDFLRDMVTEVGDSMTRMSTELNKAVDIQNGAITELGNILKSFTDELKGMRESIAALQSAPAGGGKKSITKSVERFDTDDANTLTKAQIGEKLLGLVEKGLAKPGEVVMFESTGKLSDETFNRIFKQKEVA